MPERAAAGGRAPGPLAGYRVLDLSRLLPGGFCTMLLADLGAEVVKVEEPGPGDYLRAVPPLIEGTSVFFHQLNRGKKSVALDLRRPGGRDALLALARRAHVLLEGFRPGVMAGWGLGPEAVARANPDLIYASLSGWGARGGSRRAGHDLNFLAAAGLLDLAARTAAGPGRPRPPLPPVPWADLLGGLFAALQIAAALASRRPGGWLDLALADPPVLVQCLQAAEVLATGAPAYPGSLPMSGRFACYQVYPTADGRWVSLGALEPKFWAALCRALGHPEWIPRQYDPDPAVQAGLVAGLTERFGRRTLAEWERFAEEHDVCLEPVRSLEEALAVPRLAARGLLERRLVAGREAGQLALAARPEAGPEAGEAAAGAPPDGTAPALGQHTRELLLEAGLEPERIQSLVADGTAAVAGERGERAH